jgi:DNA polymerase-3 subunit chi
MMAADSKPELWFYHLERSELERALAPLLEKCLARGWKALVRGGSRQRLEALDTALWSFRDDSFLPHGRDEDANAARQPVLLTEKAGNPNGADVLFLIDGAASGDAAEFARACLMFDGRDEDAVAAARARWKEAKGAGVEVTYWREDSSGRWEKVGEKQA